MTPKGLFKLLKQPHVFAKDYAKKRFTKDELKEYVIKAIDIDVPSDRYYYFIYKELKKEGYFSRAEVALRKAIEVKPKADYYCELSDLLYKKAQWWQICDILEKAIELNSQIEIKWYRKYIMALRNMKKFEEAIEVFDKIPYKKELKEEDYFYYGTMFEEIGNKEKANNAYLKAIYLSSNKSYQELGEGLFYTKKWQWKKAKASFKNRLAKRPNHSELLYRYAFVSDRSYMWKEAENYYTKALDVNPLNTDWYYRLGFVYERQEKWEDAIDAYAFSASQKVKKIPYRYYRLGYALAKLNRYKESCEAFLLMKEDFSLEENFFLNELLELQVQKSLTFAYNKLRVDTTNIESWQILASKAEELEDWELAEEAYLELLARKENFDSNIYFAYARTLFKQDKFKEASDIFIEQKIMQDAYGVVETEYNKNLGLKKVVNYAEYYERYELEDNIILYESYHGGSFSCNPYAIFQSIYKDERFSNYRHVWVINDKRQIPKHLKVDTQIIFITRGSDLYMRHLAKVKYLINNVSFPEYFIRKEGQLYLNTWHGTPIKTLGKDIKDDFFAHKNATRNFLQASHLISPNSFTTKILTDNFDINDIYTGIVAQTGYPRQDLTLNASSEYKQEIKNKLGIKNDKPVVLYAPTWRGTLAGSKFDIEKLIIDIKLFKNLDINFIFRGHHMAEKLLDDVSEIKDVVVSSTIDTNSLLSIVDTLITDYSSISFDYMAVGKPIIYYTYDRDEYESERGLYFPLEDVAEDIYKTNSEVAEAIKRLIHIEKISSKQQEAQEKFCAYDDGLATDRVIDLFFFNKQENVNIIKEKEKKSILIYGGAFIPNGVTTSLVNLLNTIDTNQYSVTLAIDANTIKLDNKKLAQFEKVGYEIKVIGKFGRMTTTLEEKWIIDNFNIHKTFSESEKVEIFNRAYQREFLRVFGMARFDTIISFEGYNSYWIRLFGAYQGTQNRVTYLHADMLGEAQTRFPYLYGNFQSYRLYDKLISVSSDADSLNQDNLAKEYNLDSDKFDYCNNVLNPNEIINRSKEEIADSNIFNRGKTFINIARLSPEKDHKKLIYAFSKVLEKEKKSKLIIIGDGPLRVELQQLVKKLSLKGRVLLLGQKFNPMPYLKASDCFVLSSNYEGQGLVLLEAMVLGIPVISTDISGPRSVIKDGLGLLVDNSVDGLSQGMLKFLEDSKSISREFNYKEYNKEALEMFSSKVLGE
jgi:CDP-glycerol glycerophosphotransferase